MIVKNVYYGEMYKLKFTALAMDSCFWIMPNDYKLKLVKKVDFNAKDELLTNGYTYAHYNKGFHNCRIIEHKAARYFKIHWEGWSDKWDCYCTMDDPSWIDKPGSGTLVGAVLKKKWENKVYKVKIIEVYNGELYRLRFDGMSASSDIYIKPNDHKLKFRQKIEPVNFTDNKLM